MKPIIFTGESVRAILAGTKVMTRRVIKPQPSVDVAGEQTTYQGTPATVYGIESCHYSPTGWAYTHLWNPDNGSTGCTCKPVKCPYQVGQELWVKETWTTHQNDKGADCKLYKADVPDPELYGPWESPYFMPRWASRITLEIESVKVERLNEMGFYDWVKDFHPTWQEREAARASFTGAEFQLEHSKKHWNAINAKRGYPWESNCWVFVISFMVVRA